MKSKVNPPTGTAIAPLGKSAPVGTPVPVVAGKPLVLDEEGDPPRQLFDPTVDLNTLDGIREYTNRALVAGAKGKISGQQMAGIATLLRVRLDIHKEKPPKPEEEEEPNAKIVSNGDQAMEIIKADTPPRPRTWEH